MPKLHAIFLESHEEITSVIDQIRSCPDATIVLVAAQRISLLQSLVNLKLIKRNADSIHKTILLVSTDQVAISLAEQLGIKAFSKLEHAERFYNGEDVRRETKKPDAPAQTAPIKNEPLRVSSSTESPHDLRSPDHHQREANKAEKKPLAFIGRLPWLRPKPTAQETVTTISLQHRPFLIPVLIFALLPLTVGVVAALTILPYARIDIVPKTEEFSQDMDIRASGKITEVNYLSKEIPAFYYRVSEESSATAPATKQIDIGTKAEGTVSIYNKGYSKAITLATGTSLTSYDGKIFHIKNATTIPGVYIEGGDTYQGSKKAVPIVATEAGEEYNIEKTNFTIAGFDSSLVWAESYDTFSGGESHEAVVVGQEDIDTLRTKILTDLTQKADDELQNKLTEGQIFIDGATQSSIVNETNSAEVDQEVANFTITLKIDTKGLAFNETDLKQVVDRSMSLSIPADFEPLSNQSWDTTYEITNLDWDLKSISFVGHGAGLIAYRLPTAEIRQRVAGLLPDEADVAIAKYSSKIEAYRIKTGPFWVKRIPKQTDKITINRISWDEFQANSKQ